MDRDIEDDSMEDLGGHWEDHPVRNPGEEGMGPSRNPTRGGPQGRRGAGPRDMTDLMDDMELGPRGGGRRAGGRKASHMDDLSDGVESDSYGGHAGGRHLDFERNAVSIRDLPMLKESRAFMMEKMRSLGRGGSVEERRMLQENFDMITEDIAGLEEEQREGGKMPRGMGGPMDGRGSNPRQTRTGGRGTQDIRHEQHEGHKHVFSDHGHRHVLSELPALKDERAGRMKELKECAKTGDEIMCEMMEHDIEVVTGIIDRLESEKRQGGKVPRGTGAPTRRGEQGDYSDDESEYQPRGSRRGQPESAARRGRHSGR